MTAAPGRTGGAEGCTGRSCARAIAEEILHTPIGLLPDRRWSQTTAADLRRFLAQQMEAQIERKLITFQVLEAGGPLCAS